VAEQGGYWSADQPSRYWRISWMLFRLYPIAMAAVLICPLTIATAVGEDWRGFRGNDGSGIQKQDVALPASWADGKNLLWKIDLPGQGSSSPIVVGDNVLVTCFNPGDAGRGPGRELICLDRTTGKNLWRAAIPDPQGEDPYQGFIREHGYASSTPVSDGERVISFFGKSGVFAHDLQGKQLWQASVGSDSGSRQWGSAASPLLHNNIVIVNASDESLSIRGLDKTTGQQVWIAEAAGLENTFNTPQLVTIDNRQELLVSVPNEIWGLDPAAGKLLWYASSGMDGNVSPSIVSQGGIAYAMGGRRGTTLAIRAGGKDDVSESHIAWTSQKSSYVPSPILHDGHLYWVSDRGIAHCARVDNGQLIYQKRLQLPKGDGGRGFYASLAMADGKLIAVSRHTGVFVLAASPQFKQLAHNQFANDDSQFNASPAVVDGQIFLRSDRSLYCIAGQ